MTLHEARFASMGTTARVLVDADDATAACALDGARRRLAGHEAALSRFAAASELSALNRDARAAVPASPLLCRAVNAALWAARRTGGLVDPTLLDALEHAGYGRSRAGAPRVDLGALLADAPRRAGARAARHARWRAIRVQDGVVHRPPGLRIDLGATAKGLAADLLAEVLRTLPRAVVDLGGDVRVTGTAVAEAPFDIVVEHPLTGSAAATVPLGAGAIATSGITRRAWRTAGGSPAHHLLDPAAGAPAWSGLVAVTALAPTTLEAETLAKAALLTGPAGARRWLSRHGGFTFAEDGGMQTIAGAPAPTLVLRAAEVAA
jgi:thiamine biosynthesis lipoprotein